MTKVKAKGTPSRKDEMVTGSTYPSTPSKNAPGVQGDIKKMGNDMSTTHTSTGGCGSSMGNGKLPTFDASITTTS